MRKNILDIIENCPSEIKKKFIVKNFKKGEKIVKQGFEARHFHILLKGTNKIYRTSILGTNYLQLIIGPEEIYGELELSNNKTYICTVEALSDCEVLMVPRKTYVKWLEIDTSFSMFIITKLSSKLYSKIEKSSNDVFYNLEYKFVRLALNLYSKNKSDSILISKELISEDLAASIRSINRIINKLKRENILEYQDGKIIIIDLEKLKNQEVRLLQ
ncbi:Crp/Fnr family transcriptional regulator [Clostridium sp. OS1-26]|uniref:Crp/Fnr family transcriptional regulator n=1 Tax=Clostridium sp. OS1-26 TaxID=3070681 RepID=UPI0027E08477|nr:Crp/Fnr family transcriptional regulator [Clostridium sp. OS1-26]WML34980.1 Crp/Fnr family transcriptional regulator [Clostridium sp. OS1-26]